MLRHPQTWSEVWRKLPWKKFRRTLFRLQVRLYKAVRANDLRLARQLQRLILKSASARFLAIRQVTQLNQGKKTAGVDGKKSLNSRQRIQLEKLLKIQWSNWKHSGLREIPIPKKDGTRRILKVPTLADRAWQCLVKYALEPAHEATFHARSYGFRTGRSTHDAQKMLFLNLNSKAKGYRKIILEIDIEKCFDRIDHRAIMSQLIAIKIVKLGIWRCLKAGTNPEFPDQGTMQGGVVSPLLANVALNGVEGLGNIIRYADDMVAIIKPEENVTRLLEEIQEFLAIRGLKIKEAKTRIVSATDGFDFLGWHFKVQTNGKFRCVPSEENFQAFREKVKNIVNNSNYGAKEKVRKLAPIVRGWRNYHQFCKMDGSRFSLYYIQNRAWKVFNKEVKLNHYQVNDLLKQAFPAISYSENRHINVKGDKSPYDGDLNYWSQRNSKLYDGATAKALREQKHQCGYCGLKITGEERVHLHHIDKNHSNWTPKNLMAVHESCHRLIHMSKPTG